MHAFTEDGRHLVIQDGFGLTRVSFPRGVKTDRSLAGNELSLGGNFVVVEAARSRKRVIRTVDALLNEAWAPGNYGDFCLHSDGAHAIALQGDRVQLWQCSGARVAEHRWPADLRTLDGLDLGRERPGRELSRALGVVSADGVFAHYDGAPDAGLRVARWQRVEQFEPLFRVPMPRLVGELLVFPGRDETFFGAWDRGLKRAVLYRVGPELALERRELDAAGRPTYSGAHWCWQRDARTICRAHWRELDEPERLSIPEDARGTGTVMAWGDRVYFMPTDAERLFDVTTGRAIDRKLGAKDAPVRAKITELARTFDAWLGEEGGRLTFGHVEQRKDKSISWSPAFDVGSGSLSALFAVGELLARQRHASGNADAPSVGGYSPPTSIAPCSLDDVRRAFAALEARGGSLLRAMCALDQPLRANFEPPYQLRSARGIAPPPRLFAPDAGAALARAAFATFEARADLPLSRELDRFAAGALTVESLLQARFAEDAYGAPLVFRGTHELPAVLAYLCLDLFGAEALPLLVRWLVEAPTGFAQANPHIITDVAARMIQYYPATEAPFRAACAGARGAGDQGEAILRSLSFTLRE